MVFPNTDGIKLISVDIFDTILFRSVAKPIDVFESVWQDAMDNEIAGNSMSPVEFQKLRVEMERRARKDAPNREVILKDIYDLFPKYVSKDIDALRNIEFECEKTICYRNSDIVAWLTNEKKNGKIIVLTSDMYYQSDELKELLIASDIGIDLFDSIIVSCEYKCNKQNGDLFGVLFEKYSNIDPDEMLHIGDNKNSDFDQPKKRGMRAFHYDVIPDRLYSIFDYEKIRHDVPLPEILSLRKVTMSHHEYEGEEKAAFEMGSAVIGPVLSLYITWVVERLKALGIDRIYPLMREGYLLGKLLKKEAEFDSFDLLVHPIYVSRKVTYIPSITNVNREEIENMIGARNLTVGESIVLMGLEYEDFSEIKDYLDVKYKETHTIAYKEGTLKEYIISRYLEDENIRKISNFVKEERRKLVKYLKQEIGDLKGASTIDIGFFGRIQMWMEKCLDIEKEEHDFTHFLAIGITGDKIFDGINFEGFFSTFAENGDLIPVIHRTTDVLEKLISVPEGSTIGYKDNNGKIVPIQDDGVNNDRLTRIAFEGVMEFQKVWHEFRRMRPNTAAGALVKKRELLMILHRLIDMPRKCEAETLAGFEADTNFGTNYKKGLITKEHIALAKEKGLDFIDKCNVSYTYENSNITWPKGTITMLDEFYYMRRALKNGSKNEIIKSMQETVEKVAADGVAEVALYGAGENGRQFYFICNLYNIKVNCFIDRKESIWGTLKEGIPIMGLKEAMESGNNTYIITSLFSISEISEFIKEKYMDYDRKPVIYSV